MKISSLSIKVEIGFEDIIEAIIENDSLKTIGYNIDFPIKEKNEAIVNIYSEKGDESRYNIEVIKNVLKDIRYDYYITDLDSNNYLSAYMEYLKPFKIDNLTIVPNLKEETNENIKEPVIYIGKQYAFGTGTHDTTFLALEMLKDYKNEFDTSKKTVVDIGSGSGILSLAAYRFGVTDITSIDNDATAVSCTLDNAKYNDIPLEKVLLGSADYLSEEKLKYDLVIANIETDILIDIMEYLTKLLKKDSILILSGILISKKEEMIKSINKHSLKIKSQKEKGDWMALSLQLIHY